MSEIPYIGNELELFEQAKTWKQYYARFLKPYLEGRVLEVGAGIGGTTSILCDGGQTKWLCVEPDPALYIKLEQKINSGQLPSCCEGFKGTTSDLTESEKYNAILYIDVIEHIEHDDQELARAEMLLAEKGYLIVLVPAHQSLFNAFDKAIGHYRRYDRKMLRQAAPGGLRMVSMKYLDSFGLLASVANKYLLKQEYPTPGQIRFWNRFIVPASKPADFIFNYQMGKTLIGIWQKQ